MKPKSGNLIIVFLLSLLIHQVPAQTWTQRLNGISMWSLGKDLTGKVYAGSSGTVKAIYKSTNYGDSWDTVLSNSPGNFLYICCDSAGGVYAANVSNGLMKSTNGGTSWINIPSSVFGNKSVQSVVCGKNGYVYVGTITGGVYRSTDGGTTFPDNTISTLTVVTLAVDKYNSNIIYAGASSGAPPNYGFYRSTDAGATWSDNLNPYNIWGVAQKPGGLYTITTSSGYNFDKSTNGGLNWITLSNLSGAMRGLTLDYGDNYIYTSGNGGVFRSTNDGVSFTNVNLTYSSNQVMNLFNRIFVAVSGTTNGGVYYYIYPLGLTQSGNQIPDKYELLQNYPNPFNPKTVIRFQLAVNSFMVLEIFDALGRELSVLVNEVLKAGTYEVVWDAGDYPSGVYYYKMTAGAYSDTKRMVFVK